MYAIENNQSCHTDICNTILRMLKEVFEGFDGFLVDFWGFLVSFWGFLVSFWGFLGCFWGFLGCLFIRIQHYFVFPPSVFLAETAQL